MLQAASAELLAVPTQSMRLSHGTSRCRGTGGRLLIQRPSSNAFIVHEVSDAEAQDDCAHCIAECEECTTLQKKKLQASIGPLGWESRTRSVPPGSLQTSVIASKINWPAKMSSTPRSFHSRKSASDSPYTSRVRHAHLENQSSPAHRRQQLGTRTLEKLRRDGPCAVTYIGRREACMQRKRD